MANRDIEDCYLIRFIDLKVLSIENLIKLEVDYKIYDNLKSILHAQYATEINNIRFVETLQFNKIIK